jgi:hypothetical protein
MEEAFVVRHNGERRQGEGELEESEKVEDQTEIREKTVSFCPEGSRCVTESLSAGLSEDDVVRGNDWAIGTDLVCGTTVGAEGQAFSACDVLEETIKVEKKYIFYEKSVPTRNGLNVIFEGEKRRCGRQLGNRVMEAGH